MSPRFVFRKFLLIALLLAMPGSLLIVHASLRGRGRYSGVVIFDRWDTCLLLSGDYITYVSDKVKEDLRPHRNQAIEVDASEVIQPMNPGDALIRKYTIIGPATKDSREQATEGVRIIVKPDFDRDRAIAFLITIENSADSPIQIHSDAVGPTLLGLKTELFLFDPSDGKSTAWIHSGQLADPFIMEFDDQPSHYLRQLQHRCEKQVTGTVQPESRRVETRSCHLEGACWTISVSRGAWRRRSRREICGQQCDLVSC